MILHIDMDAFYASVEEREDNTLKGRPVVVGGQPKHRGVVVAANYEAREYGVFSAMSTAIALKKCPHLKVIKPRFELYRAVSEKIHSIFARYTPTIESISLDEAFLDISGGEKLHGDAVSIGWLIKQAIKKELNLTASVGVAPNKFIAKLASDYQKPDGFTVVELHQVIDFLEPLAVSKIWGVGAVANKKLANQGIYKISDIKRHRENYFKRLMGKQGINLWQLAHGIDTRKVTPSREVKSISQESTFSQDVSDRNVIDVTMMQLVENVCFRLRQKSLVARTITIKLRDADFNTMTRRKSVSVTTQTTADIWKVVQSLIIKNLPSNFSLRLVGVEVSNFSSQNAEQQQDDQIDIFNTSSTAQNKNREEAEKDNKQQAQVDQLVDTIKQRFGKDSIKRARSTE